MSDEEKAPVGMTVVEFAYALGKGAEDVILADTLEESRKNLVSLLSRIAGEHGVLIYPQHRSQPDPAAVERVARAMSKVPGWAANSWTDFTPLAIAAINAAQHRGE